MKTNRTPLILIGAFAALLAVAIWYVLRPSDTAPLDLSSAKTSLLEESAPAPEPPGPPAPKAEPASGPAPRKVEGQPAPARMPAPKTEIAQWEYRIDEALRSQADHSAIALSLLSQVPSMPAEGQTAAAQHIVNLIADKDYLQMLPYIKNPRMETGFQEIIVAESLNRPDEVKLPVLLMAARTPKHPMADTAVSVLSVLLDANHGSDWAKWEDAVNKSLNKNAATATAATAADAPSTPVTPPAPAQPAPAENP